MVAGGNAVDAAVAATLCLGVVSPGESEVTSNKSFPSAQGSVNYSVLSLSICAYFLLLSQVLFYY